MEDNPPSVAIVDYDPDTRRGVSSLLRSAGLRVREFESAYAFLESGLAELPACLVLEIRLPGLSGLDLQRELASRDIEVPIIFIAGYPDVHATVQAMKGGAAEFLIKPFSDRELLDAVREAFDRDRAARQERAVLAALQARFETLTPREREVMNGVVTGMPNKRIAAGFGTSEVTVKLHRGRVMQKMGAASLPDLVRMWEKLTQARKARRAC